MAARAFTFPTNHPSYFLPAATIFGRKLQHRGSLSPPVVLRTQVRPWPFPIRCSSLSSAVKLQKETGMLFSFFREVGLNDEDIDFILHQHPALQSTNLERIRARSLALQSVGIKGVALHRLIRKCPRVLLVEEIDPVISFVREDLQVEIEPVSLEHLFSSTEGRLLVGFDQKVMLLVHHGVPQEQIAHILNNVSLRKAFCIKSVEEIERTITSLKAYPGIDVVIRRPSLLNYDLDTHIIPRIRFLLELSGGDENATKTVLQKLPSFLSYTLKHMESHVEFLKSYAGLSQQQIFNIILIYPKLISTGKDKKLHPRIEFLKQCNLDSTEIFKFLVKSPLFLALSFDRNIAHKLVLLVKIGYEFRTKELAIALGAVTRTSCGNMQNVIGLFLSYGLSFEEIHYMSKKHPEVLHYKSSSLEQKLDYLLEEMGRDIEEVLAFPAFLGYKLDGRIKHRYEVKRKTRGDGMSIIKLLSVSNARFSTKKNEQISVQE